jgi:GNAT superfamily N-acetyltransferase/uncharacterized glyoxalase superfamily protein PhnB
MANRENDQQPIFSHVEPVLAVSDIPQTIEYWKNVLGFTNTWTWDDPPTIGAVSWQKAHIQFILNPQLAAASKGNSIWIRLQHIESLYHFHQQKNADIVSPLADQPWGMAQYIVRDINGYYICFAGNRVQREKSIATLPSTIWIIGRIPTVEEYAELGSSVHNNSLPMNEAMIKKRLAAVTYAVVAEDSASGAVVGCALILGDNVSYYYIKDVMVRPDWQGKRVGTALMQGLTDWLEKNAPDDSLVSLISAETLEPFYLPFGFTQSFGMIRFIRKEEKK